MENLTPRQEASYHLAKHIDSFNSPIIEALEQKTGKLPFCLTNAMNGLMFLNNLVHEALDADLQTSVLKALAELFKLEHKDLDMVMRIHAQHEAKAIQAIHHSLYGRDLPWR